MKTSLFLLPRRPIFLNALAAGSLAFTFGVGSLVAQNTPPEPEPAASAPSDSVAAAEYPSSRYDKIRVKSPFEFELAKPKLEEAIDPFLDLVLAGYAGSANRVTVYLANTKTQERMTILGNDDQNKTGFRLISVNRGTSLRTTTATLEKGGVTKELSFDTKALSSMVASGGSSAAGAAAGGARGPGNPGGQPILPGQVPRPGGVPNAGARPVPYVAPTAFIPGQNNNAGGNAQANGNPAPGGVNLAGSMLNNNNGQIAPGQVQPQPAVIIPQANGTGGNANNQPNNQPRRRVVLPTQR
ncbi:MAG: hypothetical protein V4726_02190 [Verrucomicrobiota bacterium]